MKVITPLLAAPLTALLLSASPALAQTTVIADWTFETTAPTTAGPYSPEIGAGSASGFHAGAATYSSPVGDGSSHSFSANTWAAGDNYQFKVSTAGYQNIMLHFNEISSSTGPTAFNLACSTDGTTFTTVTSYTVATTPSWSSGTSNSATTINQDFTTVTAINNAPTVYFRMSATAAGSQAAGTDRIDNVAVSGSTYVPPSTPPTITAISPMSLTTNAGSTVNFSLTYTPGSPTASNYWYKVVGSTTNLIVGATSSTLTLNNVLEQDSAGYFAVLSNTVGSATSSVATLTLTDPVIISQPASALVLAGATANFTVGAAGTALGYQWYYTDINSNIVATVSDGPLTGGASVSGSATATLAVTDAQYATATNFLVVVTGMYGSVTSSPVSLAVTNTAVLAFWNFNQTNFPANLASPAPWIGTGTASYFNCTTLTGVAAPDDNVGSGGVSYIPNSGLGTTNSAWGTSNYPLNNTNTPTLASNLQCGVQFMVSTLGARNIKLSYESRVTQTASYYYRLRYTTNGGSTWTDYPASSSFNGYDSAVAKGYGAFSYDLTGFAGVDNNPNFGVQIVAEFQSTASYNVSANANYEGAGPPEPYAFGATGFSGGTVTYDLVSFNGDAITNSAAAPVISSIPPTNGPDYLPLTNYFTVTDSTTSPDSLTYSAVALDSGTTTFSTDISSVTYNTGLSPFGVNGSFTFGGSGPNRYVIFNPQTIPDTVDAAPILITVTDPATGASAATSFLVTLNSLNAPPTNSLVSLGRTNLLVNGSITIPFTVGDDRTMVSGLSFSTASDNNTLIPAANIVVNNQGTASPSVTITPATNQLGTAVINVIVNDNDPVEARSTSATIAVSVRPNTNVVAIDYFNYDSSGALEVIGTNNWSHLSGNSYTLLYTSPTDGNAAPELAGNGYATLNPNVTENLQAPLIGGPYMTNNTAVPALYMSFLVDMQAGSLPIINGTYFATFDDGGGSTANINCKVIAATNGAAAGHYRLGIANIGTVATNSVMFPMDLLPGTNYTVVAQEVLSNGWSTLWINPNSPSSPNVKDTTTVGTNLFNLANVFLRESGANGGTIRVTKLKVGTTFDSVLPSPQINVTGTNVIVTSSDPTLGLQAATNIAGPFTDVSASTPYTNGISTNAVYFRFGQ